LEIEVRRKNGKLQKEERKKGPCTKRGTEGDKQEM
jgi:hypothetical protein